MKMGGGCNSGLRRMADCLSSCVQTSGLLLISELLKWILKKRDYKHKVWTELRIVPTGWLIMASTCWVFGFSFHGVIELISTMGFKGVCCERGIAYQLKGWVCPLVLLDVSIVELTVPATRHFMTELCWHLGQEPSEHIQVTQQPIFSDTERL